MKSIRKGMRGAASVGEGFINCLDAVISTVDPVTLLVRACTVAVLALLGWALLCVSNGQSALGAARTSITAFSEPQSGTAPVLGEIKSASSSIDLEIYELDDPTVETALAAAASRHVLVRVILNRKDPYESSNPNAAAYSYLTEHHVQVKWSPGYLSLTHEKMLEVDNHVALIMSLNLSGGYSSTRDFGIVDTQPADVAAIASTFAADWQGHKITPSTGSGDLIWSPGAGDTFVKAIDDATRSIDLENEEMDYRDATSALCAAAKRGVTVDIVMTYSSEWTSAFRQLTGCGVNVHLDYGQAYYIHAKALIVDGSFAIVGSTNLSAESLWYNRELSIKVSAPTAVAQLGSWFASDYGSAKPYSRA